MAAKAVVRDLLALIGKGEEEDLTDQDVQDILRGGVKHALKAQLDIILGAENDKTKAYMAEQWLNRAGYSPVQKMAVKNQIAFEPETLQALLAVMKEDDQNSQLRAGTGQGSLDGPGGDPAIIEIEGEEIVILPGEGDSGEPGPDTKVPSESVLHDTRPPAQEEAAGGAERASKDNT